MSFLICAKKLGLTIFSSVNFYQSRYNETNGKRPLCPTEDRLVGRKASLSVTYYSSEPLERALVSYAHWQRTQVLEIIRKQAERKPVLTKGTTD